MVKNGRNGLPDNIQLLKNHDNVHYIFIYLPQLQIKWVRFIFSSVFLCTTFSDAANGPSSKKQKLDDDLEGGLEKITKAKVTQVYLVIRLPNTK